SFFYCYNSNQVLSCIIAEVNNTPWNERYVYVNQCDFRGELNIIEQKKEFHISPFMPMNVDYIWKFSAPDKDIMIDMSCIEQDKNDVQVFFRVNRSELNTRNCLRMLLSNPIATYLVHYRIYWNALLLFFK